MMVKNLIDGILIESTILDRSKTVLMERPVVTNPQYEEVLDLRNSSVDGELIIEEVGV